MASNIYYQKAKKNSDCCGGQYNINNTVNKTTFEK